MFIKKIRLCPRRIGSFFMPKFAIEVKKNDKQRSIGTG